MAQKCGMMKQRDRGGYNSHGHKHPAHLGKSVGPVGKSIGNTKPIPSAPALPAKGLTPVKNRTRP